MSLRCPHCGMNFRYEWELPPHLAGHTTTTPAPPTGRGTKRKTFGSEAYVPPTPKAPRKIWECPKCPFSTDSASKNNIEGSEKHENLHKKFFPCPYTGCKVKRTGVKGYYGFNSALALSLHLRSFHSDGEAADLARSAKIDGSWGLGLDRDRFFARRSEMLALTGGTASAPVTASKTVTASTPVAVSAPETGVEDYDSGEDAEFVTDSSADAEWEEDPDLVGK